MDPISDQFAHLSTYNYAGNGPITNIDLWGLQPFEHNVARRLKQHKTPSKQAESDWLGPAIGHTLLALSTGGGVAGAIGKWGLKAVGGFILNEAKDEVASQLSGGLTDYVDAGKALTSFGKVAAKSLGDVISNLKGGSDKLKNLNIDADDNFMQITGDFDGVEIGVQGTFKVEDGVMTIEGVDFEGAVGVGNIRKLLKEFGATSGVNKVTIIPNTRTTGANPGKTPEPFSIDIDE